MQEEKSPWQLRFERERKARKESEFLLEDKSRELWEINQDLEKQVSERTESLNKALIKARKADDAKSTFLANMSHEIRTPLNAILGFSDLLVNDETSSTQNKKHAEIINSSANNLLAIINDILDISKIESGNFEVSIEETNIYSVCEHTVELFSKNAIEKNIKILFNMDLNIPKGILTDGSRIRQVFSNILSNAIKFTPTYGVITFNVMQIDKIEDEILLRFEIIDSGIGIAEEQLESIFKPFVQIDHKSNRQYQGTGLGLSICSHIIEAFNSKLKVESSIGNGTKFWFDLKVKACAEEFSKTDYPKNLNIKIIENENDLSDHVKAYLSKLGTINNDNQNIDLIVYSYQKKDKEELKLIRKNNLNIPRLILFEYDEDLIKFNAADLEEGIALPFYPSKVNDTINELLKKSTKSVDIEDNDLKIISKDSFDAKILVAEDNMANQVLISYILEELKIDFEIKSNGEEALEAYQKEKFDLVLMDINMPVLDGISALNQIREYEKENNLNKTPIVALTANAIKGDKEKFLSLGMDDYLSKPINKNELNDLFKKFLNNSEEKSKTTVIDYEAIKKKLGISEEIVKLIVNKFKKDIKNDLDDLEDYVLEGNIHEIKQKSHYIKNSCLNMCMDEAADILQSMETKTEDTSELKTLFSKFQNIINNLES